MLKVGLVVCGVRGVATDNADDDKVCWAHIESITRKVCRTNKTLQRSRDENSAATLYRNIYLEDRSRPCGDKAALPLGSGKKRSKNCVYLSEDIYSTCSVEQGTISQIDGRTKSRILKGKYKIDGTVDLHGYTINLAYETLVSFITHNYNSCNKCVLVITGWGSKSLGENSIRRSLHHWLLSDKLISMVLYYTQATPAHGGKGAFYVLLKSKNKT